LEREQEFFAERLAREAKLETDRLQLSKPELILEYIKRIGEELINLFPRQKTTRTTKNQRYN
jgi:hypothetical protein